MKTLHTIAVSALLVLPLSLPLQATAQTANTPGGSASTGTPLDETKSKSSAPKRTSTAPSVTNPTGSLPKDASKAKSTTPADAAPAVAPPAAPAKDAAPTR